MWCCKVTDLHGREVEFEFDIICGDAPLLIGLDYDKLADTRSIDHPSTWTVKLGGKHFEFGIYLSRDAGGNYRRFVEFRAKPQTLLALLSRSRRMQGVYKMAELHPERLALRLHGWSHFTLDQMRRLAKQADVLTPQVDHELQKIVRRCDSCPLTGSNVSSAGLRRVSLTKNLHPQGNRLVEIDHVSHVLSSSPAVREQLCLSMACNSTGYGETPPVASKSLPVAVATIEQVWILRHGAPEMLAGDPGLGGRVMSAFCEQHSIVWEPRPPRRHNAIGVVERRNGVMRLVLERLVSGNDSLLQRDRVSDALLLERGNFLANLILGDQTLSSFQLLKGYQPSLVGLPPTMLSEANVRAHVQVTTSRALSRMLRSKSFNPYVSPTLRAGQDIYIHTQKRVGSARGSVGWAKHVVCRLDRDMVATRPVGRSRGKMNLTSYADVRVPPADPVAQSAFNFALSQPTHPVLSLGRREGDEANDEDGEDAGEKNSDSDDQPANRTPVPDTQEAGNSSGGSNDGTQGQGQASSAENPALDRDAPPAGDSVSQEYEEVTAFYSRIEGSALTREPDGIGDPAKDIGTTEVRDPGSSSLSPPDIQALCEKILEVYGRSNLTRAKLPFVPPWLLDQALEDELKGWDPHIRVEPLRSGSESKLVIGSHVLYCVKTRESGKHYVKARLVIHGNEERDKERLRCDASSLHFTLVRVILSMAVCFGFDLGGVDVSKAYHQSGGPPRQIRIRPPPECMLYRMMWLLLSLPYGLVDAGRQWQLAMETWLLDDLGFVTFGGLPQVFAKLSAEGELKLLVGKVSDDMLVAGKRSDILAFFDSLKERWHIGKAIVADKIDFNGAQILRNEITGDVKLSMNEYLANRVDDLVLTRDRRKEPAARATQQEVEEYRSIAGSLNFLGTGTLPEAAFVASVFLQRQPNLLVHDLTVGSRMVAELKRMDASIVFVRPPEGVREVRLLGFSDGSFNVIGGNAYGQAGYVSGLLFLSNATPIFHAYDWLSAKQRRVVYSSFGTEILACADADNRLYGLKMGLTALLDEPVESELLVDSKGLFTCITTLSDQREYRLRRTIARIRESFDSKELDRMRWISGQQNLADALTKWNPASWKLLQEVLNSGYMDLSIVTGQVRGDSAAWRRNLPASLGQI